MSSRLIEYVCEWYGRVHIDMLAKITGLTPREIRHIIKTTG